MKKFSLVSANNIEFCIRKTFLESGDPAVAIMFDNSKGVEVEFSLKCAHEADQDRWFKYFRRKPALLEIYDRHEKGEI